MNAAPDATVAGPIRDAAAGGAAAAAPAPQRIWTLLCVDDEPNILSALRRLFRGVGYRILVAEGGAQALDLLTSEPVDVVISDMRMPGMDGAQLLEQVYLRWPKITRLLLTGYADVNSTIAAVNQGQIYRYIAKPWNDAEMLLIVRQAIERLALEHEKQRLEELTQRQNDELRDFNANLEAKVAQRTDELSKLNDRLKKNYLTSIKVFSNLIELRGGQLVGHSRRVADLARRTATVLGATATGTQEVFIAGLLHDIGQIGLPDALLIRPVPLMSADERALYRKHPVLGEQALMALDDMQGVAALIRSHHERFDGQGFPDALGGDAIPLGARILAVADTFDDLQSGHLSASGLTADEARTMIKRGRSSQFDATVVDAFLQVLRPLRTENADRCTELSSDRLKPGMVLGRELRSREGVMLLSSDHVLTADLIRRIHLHELRDQAQMTLHVRTDRGTQ